MTKVRSALSWLTLGSSVLAVGASCRENELVLFEIGGAPVAIASSSAGSGGGGGSSAPPTSQSTTPAPGNCESSSDCPNGWLCVKSDCAVTSGACEPPPLFCDAGREPVCGCDGVTYWNDCVRRQNLSAASTSGECRGSAQRCESASDCPAQNAFCAQLMPPGRGCDLEQAGTCWVLPTDCDPSLDSARWMSCDFGRPRPGGPQGSGFPMDGPPQNSGFPDGGGSGGPDATCRDT
ncbi:MAG TPA: hypothetical protein VFQ61_24030, partial [Polyangiaceae bacterium]|nr:hypothetical protein [Polyangiaceae bacterium]